MMESEYVLDLVLQECFTADFTDILDQYDIYSFVEKEDVLPTIEALLDMEGLSYEIRTCTKNEIPLGGTDTCKYYYGIYFCFKGEKNMVFENFLDIKSWIQVGGDYFWVQNAMNKIKTTVYRSILHEEDISCAMAYYDLLSKVWERKGVDGIVIDSKLEKYFMYNFHALFNDIEVESKFAKSLAKDISTRITQN